MKVIVILSLLSIAASTKIRTLRSEAEIIPGSYLIKLKDDVDPDMFIQSHRSMRKNNGEVVALSEDVTNVWTSTIQGFAAKLDDSELSQLDVDPMVDYIEPDQVARIYAPVTQTGADWGTARHSRRTAVGSAPYSYTYDSTAGSNGRVYVIDTGIRSTHSQFGSRASQGVNYVTSESATDLNGHGTHCAGTVGGSTYGIAKLTQLVAVKVLSSSGSGTLANVISGIDWSSSNAVSGRVNVLSLSLGSSTSATVNAACARARANGHVVSVAAGNSNANACNYSPAGEPTAFTIGATASNDARSSFSNFGTCVDLFAPGTSITSAWYTSDSATSTISGTSMACPQVSGLAAYIGTLIGSTSAATIETRILALTTNNTITSPGTGSPNRLAANELAG